MIKIKESKKNINQTLLDEIIAEMNKTNEQNKIQFSKEKVKDLKTIGKDILALGVMEIAKIFIDSDLVTDIIDVAETITIAKTGTDWLMINEKNKNNNQIEFNNDIIVNNTFDFKKYMATGEELELFLEKDQK